jgi:tetratricopeptide (TPR) repeat protein
MQRRDAKDIAHVALTDHHIRRPGSHEEPKQEGVVAWREPPAEYRQRDLALAELQIGSKERSVKLLEALPDAQQNSDADVLSALEAVFLVSSPPDRAVALARWAVESLPQSATFALNYGLALRRAGDLKRAEREFLRSIELDPSLMRSYAELAVLYAIYRCCEGGRPHRADHLWRRGSQAVHSRDHRLWRRVYRL